MTEKHKLKSNPKDSIKKPGGQFIIYETEDGRAKIDVRFDGETVWLNQELMALLFNKARRTIGEHIQNIYEEGELQEDSTRRQFRQVQIEGEREVERKIDFYNLDVIISVGYRVRSQQGTRFRIWATQRLREYIVKGFALNDDRFKSGTSMNYFAELQERIREIRLSERFFYQKIKDIYTTSIDYDPKDENTIRFFKIVQNKLIWAVSKQTAAELVHNRVDANKPKLGMNSLDRKSSARIAKKDAFISKNYLKESELKLLGLIVEQYLAYAETMANQETPMYMKDWIEQLDVILKMNKRGLLDHAGKISRKQMEHKARAEFEKYSEKLKIEEREEALKELEEDLEKVKKLA
jgi:hypothetical protein